MGEDGDTPGSRSIHPHIPFREEGAQRMLAGAEHIVQQSFLKLCAFWELTPSTPGASALPQLLAQPLHKHERWMQRCRSWLQAAAMLDVLALSRAIAA